MTDFICICAATVTQRGVLCPLTFQLTWCIACSRIIASIPYYSVLSDFAFASSGTVVAYIVDLLHLVFQSTFKVGEYSVQHCRGAAGSPVVIQVDYLWPPATSTSLFHGWQKECQSSSSSGDLWPAAALSAQNPAQLGVRCGLPVSRNLSGNPKSVKGWTERE